LICFEQEHKTFSGVYCMWWAFTT